MAKLKEKIPPPEIHFPDNIAEDERKKAESDIEILAGEPFVADVSKLRKLKYVFHGREVRVKVNDNGKVIRYEVEDFMLTPEKEVYSAGAKDYFPVDIKLGRLRQKSAE